MINVLSLFDGMSCGQIALNKAGFEINKYYASEIDKYAISVTQYNFSNTIQLGDVRNIDLNKIDDIDLIIGGSPCQSFSFAGKRNGMTTKDDIEITSLDQYLKLKDEQFEFEGQSYLFWEYINILKKLKPKYFLLENVVMEKKWENIISETLAKIYKGNSISYGFFDNPKIEPVKINSALVSAQNRKRLYWTNIKGIKQPKDKGIYLKDILEYGFTDRDKSFCIDSCYKKGSNLKNYFLKKRRQIVFKGLENYKSEKSKLRIICNNIKGVDEKSNTLTTSAAPATNGCTLIGYVNNNSKFESNKRVYSKEGKSPSLTTCQGGNRQPKIAIDDFDWRILTPIECERLQTVPDNYTQYGKFNNDCIKEISKTQRYKMIGNGWTVDVIAHILSYIKDLT